MSKRLGDDEGAEAELRGVFSARRWAGESQVRFHTKTFSS
jgi:hypothetical protein